MYRKTEPEPGGEKTERKGRREKKKGILVYVYLSYQDSVISELKNAFWGHFP